MITQTEALKSLAKHRTDEVVITTMSPRREWESISNNPALDFPVVAMGHAPSVALGVALAQPSRRIWVFNGDGSQLMYPSALATIVHNRANNILLFVFQNNFYASSGWQPIPLADQIDFGAIAMAFGFRSAYRFDDVNDLDSKLPSLLREDGPCLVTLRVALDKAPEQGGTPNLVKEAARFKEALTSAPRS